MGADEAIHFALLDRRLTLDFLEHLFALPFAFFQARPTGDLLMRLGSNVAVRQIVTSTALSARNTPDRTASLAIS